MNKTEHARAVAETYATAWQANDLDGILNSYADDFTLHYFGDNPFSGDHVGKQAALATLLDVGALAPRTLVSVEEILAGPSSAVIVVTESILVDGQPHEIRRVLRFRVSADQFTDCWLYDEQQQVIDRAWRAEA